MSIAKHIAFVEKLKISDVAKDAPKDLVSIERDTTVEEALAVLRDNNILSVPILDKKDGKIVGILNMNDLCTAIAFQECFKEFSEHPHKLAEIQSDAFKKLLRTELFKAKAETLLGVSAESKSVWAYDETDSVSTLIEVFSKGVHRVIVTKKDGKRYILSQSDVLKYLKAHFESLGDIVNEPLSKLGLAKPAKEPLQTLSMYDSALSGFQKLYNQGWELNGIPVVDKRGNIVATLSASDLRGMNAESFPLLLLPVLDFLMQMKGGARPSITTDSSASLGEVIRKLVWSGVHRVWVLDSGKIVSVVTLSDILCKFSKFDFRKPAAAE